MTRKLKDFDSLSSLQVRRDMVEAIALEVAAAAATTRRNTAGEEGTFQCIQPIFIELFLLILKKLRLLFFRLGIFLICEP